MFTLENLIPLARPWPFRGKARLLDKLCPRIGERVFSCYGSQVAVDLSDHIQRLMYLGAYEQAETRLARSYLRTGMTFVDVGANVGYFSILSASLVGTSGRVIACEPGPYALERLRQTVAGNNLSQITVVGAGLSDFDGTVKLFEPKGHGNYTPTMVPNIGGEPVSVPVRRFDKLAAELGLPRVDLMKIDVEGHEPRVFAGASELLHTGFVRAVLCEFNDHWLRQTGSSAQELMSLLNRLGFVDVDKRHPFQPGHLTSRLLVHEGKLVS